MTSTTGFWKGWLAAATFAAAMSWPQAAEARLRAPDDGEAVSLATRPDVERFALVIGNNSTLDPGQAALRFADDDAARIAELLTEVGVDVELLASFDRDSQALFPELVKASRTPTESTVEAAWNSLVERMDEAKRSGKQVDLLFFYSGHGDVGPDGQGYLTLQGGKLKRNDLFQNFLATSPADHNHLIIDACRSEQFVLTRGRQWKPDRSAADASREVQKYLDKNHLGAYPQTGVILAHSADQQTHEWERYQGGIFSHEVISGLRGAADLNGDGEIEYSELGAFVSAANSSVKDPRARLEVVVRPPANDERRPLLVHEDVAKQRVVLFTGNDPNLYTLEDSRGIRIADIRRSGNSPGYVRLPKGEVFVQRQPREAGKRPDETRIPAKTDGIILASNLAFRPAERGSRGALDQAFREGLFATPYGTGYYTGYVDQRGLLGVQDPSWRVEIWKVEDGQEERVDVFEVDEYEESDSEDTVVETTTYEGHWWDRGSSWGGVFFGTVVTPFSQGRTIDHSRRFTANQVPACLGPSLGTSHGCSALRGFDVRWQLFHVGQGKKFPSLLGYFRTGYSGGRVAFGPDANPGYADGQATDFAYYAVPLFLGGNLIAFDRFPLRPYAGLGFGFDVLHVEYRRFNRGELRDTSGRIGFELHAGLEARITNWVTLTAEVMQQWSAKRKLAGVPDFANEGLTIITGVAVGIPFSRSKKSVSKKRTVIRASRKPKAPNPMQEVTPPESEAAEAPQPPPPTEADVPQPPSRPEAPAVPSTPAPEAAEAPIAPAPPAG
jgi:hypothetical protein